jgi:hypothetical protein
MIIKWSRDLTNISLFSLFCGLGLHWLARGKGSQTSPLTMGIFSILGK